MFDDPIQPSKQTVSSLVFPDCLACHPVPPKLDPINKLGQTETARPPPSPSLPLPQPSLCPEARVPAGGGDAVPRRREAGALRRQAVAKHLLRFDALRRAARDGALKCSSLLPLLTVWFTTHIAGQPLLACSSPKARHITQVSKRHLAGRAMKGFTN